ILLPLIRSATESAAARAQGAYLLFVVPLLLESDFWQQRVSRVLAIDCPEEMQVQRVIQRNALSEQQVRAIIETQVQRTVRLAAADDIIINDGDTAALIPQVQRLHDLYVALAQTE
ncbi:dephospho-CoA kinase, partial [Herminiimonas sp.]|uniref:dephospho-CoA kinase n=1 Tax=Herminiimonas sp. TaxID=1926289 RepID=UPI0027163F4F